MSGLEFIGRALFSHIALFFLPASRKGVVAASLVDKQEIQLSLDMCRNSSPSLLVAVNSFQ